MIIATVLTALALASSTNIFLTRFSQKDIENKLESSVLASSCVFEALYGFAENPEFVPNEEIINVASESPQATEACTIDSISVAGDVLTLYVHAIVEDSHTAFEIKASGTYGPSNSLTITSWKEVANIPP
jgi:hypothetical protein